MTHFAYNSLFVGCLFVNFNMSKMPARYSKENAWKEVDETNCKKKVFKFLGSS